MFANIATLVKAASEANRRRTGFVSILLLEILIAVEIHLRRIINQRARINAVLLNILQ